MKLVRFGNLGEEKPGLVDAEGAIRDLSAHLSDFAGGLQAQVKEAILKAFTLGGAEKYRMKVANDDPRTFCKLLGNILALQLEGDGQHPITYTIYTGVPERGDIPGSSLVSSLIVKPNGHATREGTSVPSCPAVGRPPTSYGGERYN